MLGFNSKIQQKLLRVLDLLERRLERDEASTAPVPVKAIESIVAYNWASEEDDYTEQYRLGEIEHDDPAHIYTQLRIVNDWVQSISQDPEKEEVVS